MSVVEPGSTGANIIARVQAILLRPGETWDEIEGEPATVSGLYRGYIIPLAAIPHLCSMIGTIVFGVGALGFHFRPPIFSTVINAILGYGMSLGLVFVLGLIIDALAPNFGGTRNPIQAFKVATYSMTASWVVGVFSIIPALAILGLLGLYGFYLLYKGLPKLMKVAEEKATAYTALVVVAAVVLSVCVFAILGVIGGVTGMSAASRMAAASQTAGRIETPAGSIDLDKLKAATQQMEAANSAAKDGKIVLTNPDLLKALLPASIAGFNRTDVSTDSASQGGVGASNATGDYQRGDGRFQLGVTDMGALGAVAGVASAFNTQTAHEENGRYEKVGQVNGRLTTELYDRQSKHGEYSIIVGNRFRVHAEGDSVSIDELKAAVGAVNAGALEGMAKS